MGFLDAINENIAKFKAQQQQAKHNKEILKRNEAEAQTLTLLDGHERERYLQLLQWIAYDYAILNNQAQPYDVRLAARGRLNGNIVLRDQVEAATRQYIAAPAKPEGMAGLVQGLMNFGGKKKQDAEPPPPLVSPFARRRASQQQPKRRTTSKAKGGQKNKG